VQRTSGAKADDVLRADDSYLKKPDRRTWSRIPPRRHVPHWIDHHYPEEAPAPRVPCTGLLYRPHSGDEPPVQAFRSWRPVTTTMPRFRHVRKGTIRHCLTCLSGSLVFRAAAIDDPPPPPPCALEQWRDLHEPGSDWRSLRSQEHHQCSWTITRSYTSPIGIAVLRAVAGRNCHRSRVEFAARGGLDCAEPLRVGL